MIQIIEKPNSINDDDIEMLQSLVEQYPYFTIAQALLAAGLELKEDKRANHQLRIAAAMVPDRLDKIIMFGLRYILFPPKV